MLLQLRELEAAIPGAGANLGTEKAAVWTRNRTEVADRDEIFRGWRLRLCRTLPVLTGRYFDVTLSAVFAV
jgi:hypothetical protein